MNKPRPSRSPRELPIVKLLPNLLTLAAVCAGMTAIRFAFQGNFEVAMRLVLVAGVLDGLDGRMARLLRSQSLIGAELDLFADFLNFGVTPALILYAWSLHDAGGFGWIAALCFALCCLMRLARFNVSNKSGTDASHGRYFIGVPSPAGAILVLTPLMLSLMLSQPSVLPAGVIAIYTIFVGFLMISRLPTYSFKNVTISRKNARYVMLGAVLLAASLLIYTWATLIVLTLGYAVGLAMAMRTRFGTGRKR